MTDNSSSSGHELPDLTPLQILRATGSQEEILRWAEAEGLEVQGDMVLGKTDHTTWIPHSRAIEPTLDEPTKGPSLEL